jgi:hypothetical protein
MGGRWSSIPTLASTCMLLAACSGGHARFIPHRGDGGVADADTGPPPDAVDILFLIDTGCSAGSLQAELARTSEVLLRELLTPTADPGAGMTPRPVRDLHVGVTTMTADMAGPEILYCTDPENGALVLRSASMTRCEGAVVAATDCETPPCPWLGHSIESPNIGSDPGDPPIWKELRCVVSMGNCGCGWGQPLEASSLALTIQSEPGAPNHGFIRDDSLLALVFLDNEDDCSVSDPALFDVVERDDLGFPMTRCHLNPEMLHPVGPYIEALRGLRPSYQDRIVVGVFTGLPPGISWQPGDSVEDLREMIRRVGLSRPPAHRACLRVRRRRLRRVHLPGGLVRVDDGLGQDDSGAPPVDERLLAPAARYSDLTDDPAQRVGCGAHRRDGREGRGGAARAEHRRRRTHSGPRRAAGHPSAARAHGDRPQ